MKISGFQKTSLIDYPGYIVSIVFTQGCNFRCPYCHNSDLLFSESTSKEYFPAEYIYSFVKNRKRLIDGVSISGGEPTLQPGLIDFIKDIKAMCLKVKLDTNGSRPEILETLLNNQLLDYIAMDIKGSLYNYEKIINQKINTDFIKTSIALIQNSGIDYEFRTTVIPGLHDTTQLNDIAVLLTGSKLFYIQNFIPRNTFDEKYMNKNGFSPAKLEEFKTIFITHVDRVEIRN